MLESIAARLETLETIIAQGSEQPRPLLHPAMARRYREQIAVLREALARDELERFLKLLEELGGD